MEKIERDIIKLLKEDARYTPEKIGVMLNLPADEVREKIVRLEKEGVIVKYTALINEEKLGTSLVDAWIEVKVTPQQNMGFDAIAEKIYGFDEVRSVYLMSGGYDLAVCIEDTTLRDVAMFVSKRLSVMDNVISTATHFILKKYKIDGVIMERKEDNRRIAVQP